jgi:flagellar biogenesis protein FliO
MNRKRWLLLFSFVVLVALAVLASSLHDVQFQPGRSVPSVPSSPSLIAPLAIESLRTTPLWKILLFWVAFLIGITLLIYLLPPDIRKRLLKQMFGLAIGVLAFIIALRYRIIQLPQFVSGPPVQPTQLAIGLDSKLPTPTFQPPAMVPWVTYLISLGVLLALLLIAWTGYRWWMRSRVRRYSRLNDLAEIARSSLDDLASGREWGDVIIQSYVRMSDAVSERRGLFRAEAMTPREFADRLEFAGLPADAVKRLTRLFESVRYGGRESSQTDVHEAIACLNSILQACGAV